MTTSFTLSITTLLSLLLTLLGSTSAYPSERTPLQPHNVRNPSSSNLSAYAPVLTAGTQSLPAPTGTLTYITLGRGTQNYTCSSNSTDAPISIGATATLFDATALLPSFPSAAQAQAYLNSLPASTVDSPVSQIDLPVIGKHFFTASGVPTWELFSSSSSSDDENDDDGSEEKILYGTSIADIPAPQDADRGPQGYGAVDWKVLRARAESVGGLGEVFRVETAGGSAPPDCAGFEGTVVRVEYATMYWFYA